MKKKIVLLKHKNQEIYPATYSLAIIHKGELLYDVLDAKLDTISDLSNIRYGASLGVTSLLPTSLKTINNESLIGSGNIDIQAGSEIFGDHLFPHDGYEAGTDVPIRFIGYKGQPSDDLYTGENWLKIGNDHAQLSGKYTLSGGKSSLFNFNAAGFDFKRFDENSDLKTRFSVKNDISLSARHINFLCLNRNDGNKDLTRTAKIIFGDYYGEIYATFDVNRFSVATPSGLFNISDGGAGIEHDHSIHISAGNSEILLDELNKLKLCASGALVKFNEDGIYSECSKYIKHTIGVDKGVFRINGDDGCFNLALAHKDHINYIAFNDDIHIGSVTDRSTIDDIKERGDSSGANDIIKVKADGKVFVKGIGTFDGTNADTAQSLQEVIEEGGLDEESAIVIAAALNDLNERLLAIENLNQNL